MFAALLGSLMRIQSGGIQTLFFLIHSLYLCVVIVHFYTRVFAGFGAALGEAEVLEVSGKGVQSLRSAALEHPYLGCTLAGASL